ncbi:hypothetical protein [Curtobacterium sp. MCSS17_016]|uniref:hypothetical protein n=1 Tax=Curtobacterium sp. MCSS17_016 TaxID=2175644 RepID=UPI0011B5D259|nr:hypothetical protein [Curtobacterium sp. MCSS17_016]WIE81458.1 hypothetical protein DEJ19_019675 [Curtobacterium sp. MCSS17_016]
MTPEQRRTLILVGCIVAVLIGLTVAMSALALNITDEAGATSHLAPPHQVVADSPYGSMFLAAAVALSDSKPSDEGRP